MSTLLNRIKPGMEQAGLNITGVAQGEPWQSVFPGCQSVIVIGSGGDQLWNAFISDLERSPGYFKNEPDILDNFVTRTLNHIDPEPPESRRWIRCAANEQEFIDFRVLGHQAGLGWHSKLGLLLHPEYGPWFGLRLACFTTEHIEPTGTLRGAGPCADCDAPCIPSCPAGAVSDASSWNAECCADFHSSSDQCLHTCHARDACPEGRHHIYSEMQRHYHSDRSSGRTLLAQSLGLEPDELGTGPHWGKWSSG